MFEVEIKFRVDDLDDLERRLKELGVELGAPVEEMDRFYQHPSRDFAQTDEALRMRRQSAQDRSEQCFLTYKGPKIDSLTKTRREIEVSIADTEPWDEILRSLGFLPRGFVRKIRRHGVMQFEGRPFNILLDHVPDLLKRGEPGSFVELETLAPETEFELAKNSILALAEKLHLAESIRTSYYGLLHGGEPQGESRGVSPRAT